MVAPVVEPIDFWRVAAMDVVRVWFKKTGKAKYISHLDLMRYITRMLRKTDLNPYYTQGFNPRISIVFALSLPLGVEGLTESFDIKLPCDMSSEYIKKQFDLISSPEITFTGISKPVYKPIDIRYAEYTITLFECSDDIKNLIISKLSSDELTIIKRSKKGAEKSINLLENIVNLSVGGFETEFTLNLLLPAGNFNNINPLVFLSALLEETDYDYKTAKIVRNRLLIDKEKNYA